MSIESTLRLRDEIHRVVQNMEVVDQQVKAHELERQAAEAEMLSIESNLVECLSPDLGLSTSKLSALIRPSRTQSQP